MSKMDSKLHQISPNRVHRAILSTLLPVYHMSAQVQELWDAGVPIQLLVFTLKTIF